jgi:hypothetical protein
MAGFEVAGGSSEANRPGRLLRTSGSARRAGSNGCPCCRTAALVRRVSPSGSIPAARVGRAGFRRFGWVPGVATVVTLPPLWVESRHSDSDIANGGVWTAVTCEQLARGTALALCDR